VGWICLLLPAGGNEFYGDVGAAILTSTLARAVVDTINAGGQAEFVEVIEIKIVEFNY
jgi:hypothetical protein